MKPARRAAYLLIFFLLTFLIRAEKDFKEQVFKALIKKLAKESVKIDEDNIPIIRATADEISKRLVAHNMQFIVEAELAANKRQKRGILMFFAQGLLMTVITAIMGVTINAIQTAAAATPTTTTTTAPTPPHIIHNLPKHPQIPGILNYNHRGSRPLIEDPQFLNIVRNIADAQIDEWASKHMQKKMYEDYQKSHRYNNHHAPPPYMQSY